MHVSITTGQLQGSVECHVYNIVSEVRSIIQCNGKCNVSVMFRYNSIINTRSREKVDDTDNV